MSVHRMPPQDEPFDPRQAALTHAGAAAHLAEQGWHARIVGELANAVACGLVYVGDSVRLLQQVDAGPVEEPTEGVSHDEAVSRAARAIAECDEGPRDPTLIAKRVVSALFPLSEPGLAGPAPTDSWREFLREQAAQIPEGVEAAVRELISASEEAGWQPQYAVEPLQSLVDWLNQLENVKAEFPTPVPTKMVRALTRCALEVDGQRHELEAGDALEVPVTVVMS